MTFSGTKSAIKTLLASALMAVINPVMAQEQVNQEQIEQSGVTSALLEEITVTARKREEPLQQVPISISAFTGDQIEALKVRDLQDLSFVMPNVAMDKIGTIGGFANFSIRGLGINSSIPGVDPTVGVFIDGVYLGQNDGTVIDMFDVESIEVLRGPQGTLFGRNVVGGAVLINTRRPTEELAVSLRGAVEGNPNGDGGKNYYFSGAVSGPLSDTLGGRISVYHNEDNGWFVNQFDGKDFGEASTTIIRPVLDWQPTDNLEMQLRWEHTTSDNDGPAPQSHTNASGVPGFYANFDRDSHGFSIDEPGKLDYTMNFVTFRTDWDIALGDGTITNIFGWRHYKHDSYGDIDAQPVWLYHFGTINKSEQYSNELRYSGSFDNATVTTGIYWLDNKINYSERRDLLGVNTGNVAPALTQHGGGILKVKSLAWFGSLDYTINDNWLLNAGLRYTHEKKDAQIATLTLNVNDPCLVYEGTCDYDFVDDNTWNAWSGKLGFTNNISDNSRMYAHWSRGHRSGGYNLRNTAIDTVNFGPGPFDEETVDSYEIGFKTELGGRGRLNAAVFHTKVDDIQRTITESDPFAGTVQLIRNTADVKMNGFEVEGAFAIGNNTALLASVGYVDPKYTAVRFDLNGDGVIDEKDKDLKLPRAAKWTFSIGATHDWFLENGSALSVRGNYAYRDDAYFTDNNLGYFLSQKILDAGLDYTLSDSKWVFSLYGRNLLNSVNHGTDAPLPTTLGAVPLGGSSAMLVKGRVVGFEVVYNY